MCGRVLGGGREKERGGRAEGERAREAGKGLVGQVFRRGRQVPDFAGGNFRNVLEEIPKRGGRMAAQFSIATRRLFLNYSAVCCRGSPVPATHISASRLEIIGGARATIIWA
jgi:hypothetical protein